MDSIIKRLREEKGYTQPEIADKIDKSVRQYQRYEYKKSKLPFVEAMKLAQTYNVPVEQLYK